MAGRSGCAVFGNAHFNKSSGSEPLSLITGSAAFGNVARAALGFAQDDTDDGGPPTFIISQIKNNLGRTDLPSLAYQIDEAVIDTDEGPARIGRLVMMGTSPRSVGDVLRRIDGDHAQEDRREIDGWLIEYLSDSGGEAPAVEVIAAAKGAGFSETQVKKARQRVAKSQRHGFGRSAFYTSSLAAPH